MKYVSFENQQNGNKYLLRSDLINRVDVRKHDNPESNRLVLHVYECDRTEAQCYEVTEFDYDRFVSFLKLLEEETQIFKIDVMR